MIKHKISIVGFPILYNIFEEIKNNLSFNVENYNRTDEFFKFFTDSKLKSENFFILTGIKNKDFFLKKIKLNIKNIFFICNTKNEITIQDGCNIIKYPIDIYNLIEKINIQIIKCKYDLQSKIIVQNYSLDLNSRIISNDKSKLKLTEREMEIIVFLHESKTPQKIVNLQSKVWGYLSELETHTVETHVYRLRKKINESFNDDDFLISTEDGYFIK